LASGAGAFRWPADKSGDVRTVSERTTGVPVDHVFANLDGGNVNVSGMGKDNDFLS
jgi:hypothetical protein